MLFLTSCCCCCCCWWWWCCSCSWWWCFCICFCFCCWCCCWLSFWLLLLLVMKIGSGSILQGRSGRGRSARIQGRCCRIHVVNGIGGGRNGSAHAIGSGAAGDTWRQLRHHHHAGAGSGSGRRHAVGWHVGRRHGSGGHGGIAHGWRYRNDGRVGRGHVPHQGVVQGQGVHQLVAET